MQNEGRAYDLMPFVVSRYASDPAAGGNSPKEATKPRDLIAEKAIIALIRTDVLLWFNFNSL